MSFSRTTPTAKTSSASDTILRGTSVVGLNTLASRFLGFVRDLLLASLLGAGMVADAFVVAFRIPNILRSFVAEGALTSAFVPVLTDELHIDQQRARMTLRSTCSLLLAATLVLTGLGMIFASPLVGFFAPGFGMTSPKHMLCTELLQLMMPYIMFVSIVALANGALNAVKIFGTAAFAQVAMNFTMIIGILAAGYAAIDYQAHLVAVFVLIGGIFQIVVQLPALHRADFSLRPSREILTPATRKILQLMAPALLGAAIYQLSIFLNTLLASLLQEGSVSWLFYADRLAQLPIGIFTVALASVLLPTLSSAATQRDELDFERNVVNALRYTSFFIIPMAIGLFLLAEPIIQLCFERGAFRAEATAMTSLALQALTVGLWGLSCQLLLSRAFIAKKDTVTPAVVGLLSLVVNLIAALLLMGTPQLFGGAFLPTLVVTLQETLTTVFPAVDLGHIGLAFAPTFSTATALIAYLWLLRKKGNRFELTPFIRSTFKSLLAGCGMALVVSTVTGSFSGPTLKILIGIPAGIFSYTGFVLILKSREFCECLIVCKGKLLTSDTVR